RRDVPSYVFTLVVLFPVFLVLVYASSRFLDRLFRGERTRGLAHLVAYGSFGLLLEWTLMGMAPWSNPRANPLLMLVFQLGMFSFWATVATAPRVFLDPQGRDARRRILRFYVPYFVVVYVVGLSVRPHARFAVLIPPIILGYLIVTALLVKHFL